MSGFIGSSLPKMDILRPNSVGSQPLYLQRASIFKIMYASILPCLFQLQSTCFYSSLKIKYTTVQEIYALIPTEFITLWFQYVILTPKSIWAKFSDVSVILDI